MWTATITENIMWMWRVYALQVVMVRRFMTTDDREGTGSLATQKGILTKRIFEFKGELIPRNVV